MLPDRFVEICLPAGINEPRAGRTVSEDILCCAEAVQQGIRLKRQQMVFVLQQDHALGRRLKSSCVMRRIPRVLLPSRQGAEAERLISEGAAVIRLKVAEGNRILPVILSCDLAHRNQQAVQPDNRIHEKCFSPADLDSVHLDRPVSVLSERSGQADWKRIGAFGEGTVFAVRLFQIQCFLHE